MLRARPCYARACGCAEGTLGRTSDRSTSYGASPDGASSAGRTFRRSIGPIRRRRLEAHHPEGPLLRRFLLAAHRPGESDFLRPATRKCRSSRSWVRCRSCPSLPPAVCCCDRCNTRQEHKARPESTPFKPEQSVRVISLQEHLAEPIVEAPWQAFVIISRTPHVYAGIACHV